MAIIPPYLKPGDCVGVVCPSGYMPYENAATCLNILQTWGYKVKVGKTLGNQFHYFAGTDEERLNDLQQMLDDDEVKAIMCARGGYGLGRIIDQLKFKKFCKSPKWIIGFSDISILHAHIYRRFNIATLHAPMAAAFNNDEYKNEYITSLHAALEGVKGNYICASHEFNKSGIATGELVGGNLSLIAHLIGTSSEIKTKGRILFLEDIGEYIYNVDRMLYQLKRSGKFDKLAGLIIGWFSDSKDTTVPYGKPVYDVIQDVIKEYDYPVCFGFPTGHEKENYALKVGGYYKLMVSKENVHLKEN